MFNKSSEKPGNHIKFRSKNRPANHDDFPSDERKDKHALRSPSLFKRGQQYALPKTSITTPGKSEYGTEGRPTHIAKYKGNDDGIGFYEVPNTSSQATMFPSKAPEKMTKRAKRVEPKHSDQSENKTKHKRCLIS